MVKLKNLLLIFWVLSVAQSQGAKIGLLVMATGKYIQFVEPLIKSADKFFCTKHEVTYFVFTDGQVPVHSLIIKIEQKRLGWPLDTLMRPAIYHKNRDLLSAMDYLYACDADMEFVGEVGDEILQPLVGTLHPGFVGTRGTPDHNPISTAYIAPGKNHYYFAGGFNGGSSEQYLKMCGIITRNILADQEKGYVALWHDESHLNRYFLDNPPTVLNSSYCYVGRYQDRWPKKWPAKLVALDKDHAALRK